MREMAGALLAALASAACAGESLLASIDDAAAWSLTQLPNQKVPATRFSRVAVDGRQALRIEAQGSYGNLVHAVPARAAGAHVLAWQWRLDRPVPEADLRQRATDDAAAKICVMYDMPLDRVPFLERQTLRLASAASGQVLPAATICYVWDTRQVVGTVLPNAYTRRMRWIVLRGAESPIGRWQSERRDLAVDFARAFGDESSVVPPIAAVLVGADADNTGGSSLAHVAALELMH